MTNEPGHSDYRSIFLADDWAHQKYFGWKVAADLPGMRVLSKPMSVFERYLVLLSGNDVEMLAEWVRHGSGAAGRRDVVIHDFSDSFAPAANGPLSGFHKSEQRERLLNIGTFAIDLAQDEDTVFGAMSSDYRRKIRKATKAGLDVEVFNKPDAALVTGFVEAFRSFAAERGLNAIDYKTVTAMYANGDAVLFVIRRGAEITNYLHIYTAGDAGQFMYGINPSKENDGAGQNLHWQAMRYLKRMGYRWYDLGGIASTDPADGIFNFKQKFGGQLVDLGSEWRRQDLPMRYAVSAVKTIRQALGR